MSLSTPAIALFCFILIACVSGSSLVGTQGLPDRRITAIPTGYSLMAYDDCGVAGRQPHVDMADSYFFTFQTTDNDADLKSRTAVFSYKGLRLRYEKLPANRSYVLALTYATDQVYKRVQSLWANGSQLHEPIPLPKGKAIKVFVEVPRQVTDQGHLDLEIKIHGEVNATASVVELWCTGPTSTVGSFDSVSGLWSDLTGRLLDAKFEGEPNAEVQLMQANPEKTLSRVKTRADGTFAFPKAAIDKAPRNLKLVATVRGSKVERVLLPEEITFEPVRYRPLPSKVDGVTNPILVLDGKWRINADPGGKGDPWADFTVPGQWQQQGFIIPRNRTVAMAKEFSIPKQWAGKRVFVRFDSIHAGVRYSLNGKAIGESENLYTPVEFEITRGAKVGQTNRLDLQMVVDTPSEALSYSSDYAFHNLGGIDRSVRVYVLPTVQIRDLRLTVGLDKGHRDARLGVQVTLDNGGQASAKDLALELRLTDPKGKRVQMSLDKLKIGSLARGAKPVKLDVDVPNPQKWNAEKPELYTLTISLLSGGVPIERIRRKVGFRQVEIRNGQILLNGKVIKLAGAGRHEVDPLTGRAATKAHARQDMLLMKAANLNYVRTCHYPPTMEMVEAADELGIYLEVEAPFCWAAPGDDAATLRRVLAPTSAMLDYYNSHPSVLIWSVANESLLTRSFEISAQMCKSLDQDRITTFNNPDPKKICDTLNLHYPAMPFDAHAPEDRRPVLLGEFFFPVCHEQTDVRIDPGLRELWGAGKADPTTAYAKALDGDYERAKHLLPGAKSDVWSSIYRSKRVAGAAMFAAMDDAFYFPDGSHAGYAWAHGYWGLLDVWRRPKPEYWLCKLIFCPVWFPTRQVAFEGGQKTVRVPIENRYAFTDLRELRFAWELGSKSGRVEANCAPGGSTFLVIPVPAVTASGDKVTLRVSDTAGREINTLKVLLGSPRPEVVPSPTGGAPKLTDEGGLIVVEGAGFGLVLDKNTGQFVPGDPRHRCAMTTFPSVHVTRYDFGDLAGPNSPPYAVFPDRATRVVEGVSATSSPSGVSLVVRERFASFTGSTTLFIASNGVGSVAYSYNYSGEDMNAREIGIVARLRPDCDELKWRRWSEWDVYPEDQIGRTEGTARAWRPDSSGPDNEAVRPTWPWALDQTALGTADFRGVKLNIYEASLGAPGGQGLKVFSQADAHVRACVEPGGIAMHVLSDCRIGPVVLHKGAAITGQRTIQLLGR